MTEQIKIPTIYIPICDENLWVLKPYIHLFKKFWSDEQKVVIMGFEEPDFELPDNFTFVSLAPEQKGGASNWTKYLYDYFSSIDDQHIIFSLEDFFPTQEPNLKLLHSLYKVVKADSNIGRCDLTWDSFINIHDRNNSARKNKSYKIYTKVDGHKVLQIPPSAPYRISTQPAIWKRSFLLQLLNNNWSPWQFEVNGTLESSHLPQKIIAIADSTYKNYPTYWVHKGAVSRYHKDKINVLGLDTTTIKELVDNGIVEESKLQWGQWNGEVPSFHDLGGYEFSPLKMPLHEASPTDWKEYTHIYKTDKLVVNLFDNTFSHTKDLWGYITATGVDMWGKPKQMEFVPGRMKYDGITFFVDDYASNPDLVRSVKSKYKVAWLIEPRALKPSAYNTIDLHNDIFDLVITHDKNLIQKYDNCRHFQQAECRIEPQDWGIHKKTKLVSLLAANKKMLEGHRFRFTVAEQLHKKHQFDLWGSAFGKYCDNKTEALKDYYFSITIHNVIEDNFFTDGIIDCFGLGTIPIFRGCPNIGDFFDKDGIITFTTIEELDNILNNLTPQDYHDRIEAVKKNYVLAQEFKRTNEDQIVDHIKKYFDERGNKK